MDRVEHSIADILDGHGLIVADIGAANGLPANLTPLGRTATVLFFEPNADSAKALQAHLQGCGYTDPHVLSVALSDGDGLRTLYLTNVPTGTSLLKPGSDFFNRFGDPNYFHPVREVTIETRRLERVLAEAALPRLDSLKIDTQGAELQILRGLGGILHEETLCVELEIGFPGAYVDQPGFGALDALLTGAGFHLFDLRPVSADRHRDGDAGYYRREVFGVAEQSRSITRRIGEADGVYFRCTDQVLARKDPAIVRRLMVMMGIYGYFIDAWILAEDAERAGILSRVQAEAARTALRDWHCATCDLMTEVPAFVRLADFLRRAWRFWQKRLLGRRFQRWTES